MTAFTWHITPLLKISVALHLVAAAVTLIQPHWWPWTLATVIADHLLLTALGLWPRSHGLGSNWTRLPPRRPHAPRYASPSTMARTPR